MLKNKFTQQHTYLFYDKFLLRNHTSVAYLYQDIGGGHLYEKKLKRGIFEISKTNDIHLIEMHSKKNK